MFIELQNVDNRPYKYLYRLGNQEIPASSVDIKLDAADTHGTITMINKDGNITFRFSQLELRDKSMIFYVHEEY